MKSILTTLSISLCCLQLSAQAPLTELPSGKNPKASVSEQVGLTEVTIRYSRPAVRGREGKIWGGPVHMGFADQGFGSSKSAPWRAGANENTTITFSNDVVVEGQPVPAGTYGFFVAYDPNESTVILSRNHSSWGSYYYDPKEDVIRAKVKPVKLNAPVERLRFDFIDENDSSATIGLAWENLMIPFRVGTHYINDQVSMFRKELRSEKGFHWSAWQQAAQWALQHNANLDEALLWADTASGPVFGGNRVFMTHATKAGILRKLGRDAEADAIMKTALPIAGMQELHGYGRELISQKKPKEAMDVFQLNHRKNPNEFTTRVGLARGYAAMGDYKNALKFAQLALPQAPDPQNKQGVATMIEKLKKSEDVN
ncbi:MAG: DUF2911 domain-containing protein [Chitinophagaceae bacterium]|nr:MAG: DUF2911 domain-containing protein [Chitinophagaceae bacterium]